MAGDIFAADKHIYSPISEMNSTVSMKLDGNEPVKTGSSPDN